MKTFFHRTVGQPPGKGATQLEQLWWIRRILWRWSTPLMVFICAVLALIGHQYVVAAVFAALQVLSLASISRRISRAQRQL